MKSSDSRNPKLRKKKIINKNPEITDEDNESINDSILSEISGVQEESYIEEDSKTFGM